MSNFEAIRDRAFKLTSVEFERRDMQLAQEIDKAKSNLAARGLFHSGAAIGGMKQIISREFEIRAMIAWKSLVRAHEALGAELFDDLQNHLLNEMNRYIKQLEGRFSAQLKKETQFAQNMNIPIVLDKVELIKKQHEIEIQLYVDTLSQRVKKGLEIPVQSYNFYGDIGAVQTGPYAAANIVQHLGPEDNEALLNALGLVKQALFTIEELSSQRDEIIQLINESESAIKSDKPNNLKVKSMLHTIALSLQTISSAQTAYQALKTAIIPLGITLP